MATEQEPTRKFIPDSHQCYVDLLQASWTIRYASSQFMRVVPGVAGAFDELEKMLKLTIEKMPSKRLEAEKQLKLLTECRKFAASIKDLV